MRSLPQAIALAPRPLAAAGLAALAALLCALAAQSARADFSSKSAGTSGAAFLKIGAGARPTGMGEAFTAVADDVNAVSWNQAGLSTLKKNEFVGMRAQLFQGMQYNYFAFAHPTESHGTFAIAFNNLNITSIEQRAGDTDSPDSTFDSNDTAYTLAYAFKLAMAGLPSQDEEGGLHLGGGVKFIRQTLASEAANSVAADVGTLYQSPIRPFTLGLSVQNLGSNSKFKNESDPLPLTIRAGTSYRIGRDWDMSGLKGENDEKNGLLLALDANFPRDDDPSLRMGAEYGRRWSDDVRTAFRAGYRTDRARELEGTGEGVSAGAGFTYRFFTFDFSWTPMGALGNTFRYSVRLRF